VKKIRVGIIGTGFGAKVHSPMMNFHNGFDVVAISSVTRGDIEEARLVSGIENIYTDWKLMLEQEQLDLVVVASAVYLHKEMVISAYKKGIHVLCEKPMAINTDQSAEMISAKNSAQKLGLINHEFRFLPARTKVKEILDSESLGQILHVRYLCSFENYSSLVSRSRGWLGQAEQGGGMLGAIGSHMTDTLQWLTTSKFKDVMANLPIHVPLQTDGSGHVETRTADDAFQVIGTLQNGATVTMELLSAANQTANTWRLEIFGTKGTLIMLDDNKVFYSEGTASLQELELLPEITAPNEMPAIAARYYNGFHRMLDALYETFISGEKHPYLADFEDGYATQKVLDAVRLSSGEGRKVTII
jgi:predicted dehydrogenase